MKRRFAYIFPNHVGHPGLAIKYFGQLSAFRKKYTVKSVCLRGASTGGMLKKLAVYLYLEWCSICAMRSSDIIYVRYNPKLLITNFLLPYLKDKSIYLEINTIFEHELKLLNRPVERRLNAFFMSHMNLSRHITYVGVTKQIQQDLINRYGVAQPSTCFIQNGYYMSNKNPEHINHDCLNQMKDFHETFSTIGIFVGGGFPWHGIESVIQLAKQHSDIGFIIIAMNHHEIALENVRFFGAQTPDTIRDLYHDCHFGIGSFNSNLKGLYETCSLKVREYLCHGLRVLTNELDSVVYIDALNPYLFNLKQNPNALNDIRMPYDKNEVKRRAQHYLSWDRLLADI